MNEEFVRNGVMSEKFVKNFVMNAKIDPKVVMDLSIKYIYIYIYWMEHLQPINQNLLEELLMRTNLGC